MAHRMFGERCGTGSVGSMQMMTAADPSDVLRIGDREREQAVAVLHDAVGGGYLDLTEFEQRSATVYAAKTRGDLRSALSDLPGAAHLLAANVPTVAAGSPEIMDIGWTTVKRQAGWEVPPYLMISGSMGGADLDLTQAVLSPGGCVIEVEATWSTVKILLSEAMSLRTHEYRGGQNSTLKDKSGPPTVPGGPVIDVRGRAPWTTIVVKRA